MSPVLVVITHVLLQQPSQVPLIENDHVIEQVAPYAAHPAPVWDVESGGTVGVLVADCQRPQSRARLKPETMTVTFEEFSPTHDFFDYTG
jgi:hypothetical protein